MIIKPLIGNPLWPLHKSVPRIPMYGHPNGWLNLRKHDVHTGVDLFAEEDEPVYSMYEGTVVDSGIFTSTKSQPWWNDTFYTTVRSEIGGMAIDVVYGELSGEYAGNAINGIVHAGALLGCVCPVIKNPKQGQHPSMLHVEIYGDITSPRWHATQIAPVFMYHGDYGQIDTNALVDPTPTLKKARLNAIETTNGRRYR